MTQTFIVRLLVDPGPSQALHGSVQPVGDTQLYPFKDAQSLWQLLCELSGFSQDTPSSLAESVFEAGNAATGEADCS